MLLLIIGGIIGLLAGLGIGSWNTNHAAAVLAEKQLVMEVPLASDFLSMQPRVEMLPADDLSSEESQGLVYMREEEKLARDLYTKLFDRWNVPLFRNIAQSEQTHTDAIRLLLQKYNVEDPVVDDSVGVFTDQEIQKRYNELLVAGMKSLPDALAVGATVEDLDIIDLDEQLNLTDNPDIRLVYQSLQRGSRNHLRSFVLQLEEAGVEYKPQYMDQGEYTAVIHSERETATQHDRGWGSPTNKAN